MSPLKKEGIGWFGPVLVMVTIVAALAITVGAKFYAPLRISILKVTGRVDEACSWRASVEAAYYEDARMNARLRVAGETQLVRRDGDLLLWKSPYGDSWISGKQRIGDARFRAPDLHHWPPRWAQDAEDPTVMQGDIVIDCGGHIGESAAMALKLGASLVVTVEPDPLNAEAIRRNLADHIEAGRLIVVEKGVWDSAGTLNLERGEASTMSTLEERPGELSIAVTTIDEIVRDLKLERVDFIKMDIEGAEPRALQGARDTLKRFKPRLAVGAYHHEGDRLEIPAIVLGARSDYSLEYARCLPAHGGILPHELFFQ